MELDWVMPIIRDMLSARMLEGQTLLPNGQRLPELSEDMLDKMPEKPTMHHLVISDEDKLLAC